MFHLWRDGGKKKQHQKLPLSHWMDLCDANSSAKIKMVMRMLRKTCCRMWVGESSLLQMKLLRSPRITRSKKVSISFRRWHGLLPTFVLSARLTVPLHLFLHVSQVLTHLLPHCIFTRNFVLLLSHVVAPAVSSMTIGWAEHSTNCDGAPNQWQLPAAAHRPSSTALAAPNPDSTLHCSVSVHHFTPFFKIIVLISDQLYSSLQRCLRIF